MRKYVSVAAGGMSGAILRFLIRNIDIPTEIPLDTLAVNVLGSFLLALVLTLAMRRLNMHEDVKTGLTVGFFGAFTTFSSICEESITLLSKGQVMMAVVYIALTTMLGIAAAFAGYRLAKWLAEPGAADVAEVPDDEDNA